MAKSSSESFDYQVKAAELERIIAALQNPQVDIAEATSLHAAGHKLVEELEKYLKQAEITVRKHVAE
ncbi:MAG TPA: exodeoxyribonuclease VII small subunit [Candidatus Saccharimonadales bacterium]|nr:exodeoxyribonuclease VII small subunit [Candidatus Saccharimonadales bacterium]